MGIKNIVLSQTGVVGVIPSIAYIATDNTVAEITASGYLNNAVQQGYAFSESMMCLVSTMASAGAPIEVGWFEVSKSGANWSLVSPSSPGEVVLPTIANHLAVFTNTTGTLSEDVATAINGGNIQAGLSGTAGYFAAFPATAARGSLRLVAANSAGNTVTQITNASMAAARVFTIPDGGQAASNFIISDSASNQTISTGGLIVSQGNVQSGSSGDAGTFIAYPATAANGTLIIAAANAGGAFNTTISNGTMGQSSVYTIPDVVNAAGRFLVGAGSTPFVSGNFPVASGTGGLMVDSGLAASNIQNKTNIIAATTADIGGAGAGPISVVVAGLTAASVVVASVESSSNTVAVAKCNATGTGFDITFTGDPGAACTVNYIAFIAAQ